ncbi:Leader peptidase (Prepilin peptidase) [Acidisarcina polymorpha]|uniref:Prepilin leader peptidase/N-methyltransferase n=1 Tax=Acidisarcina polymorpha TaxID=2211140 RepID=A0A2Z5G643_9BACT|nr:A24 family peptidase [Acidisarcina polymorpha]AXC14713.1 Leader peptidase (Prepilin peptidase) [Acidisarcina polymorpha]
MVLGVQSHVFTLNDSGGEQRSWATLDLEIVAAYTRYRVPELISIFTVLAGLIFGSFLNVCISRLPQHESIVRPRSRCPVCRSPISSWDNIPILSWILLRGRCRACRSHISRRYPLIEATTAALFLLSILQFGMSFQGVAACVLCWLLLGLAAMDAETMLLPDALTVPGTALGVAYSGFYAGEHFFAWRAAGESLLAAAVAAAFIMLIRWLYWLARRREGIGLGDAKLLAMIAAWMGLWQAGLALFLAVVAAAAYGLILIALRRRLATASKLALRIPLGAFLGAGGIFALFEGMDALKWYFDLYR